MFDFRKFLVSILPILKDSKLSNSIHKYNLAVETQDMQYDVGLILSQILQRLGYSCKSESGVANED